jgi:catecholate siderophore receptor
MSDWTVQRFAGVRARRGALAAAGLALVPADAFADSPAPLDEVVVTAAAGGQKVRLDKLPSDQRDIPQSVTVLDRTLLQTQGAASLADALRNVPGITLGGAEGGQIGNNINLNGFSARTDIFLDGLRDRGQYYRDTFALEQVEVLMGPSSMLFGRGSTGGAIDQVSKQAKLMPGAEAGISLTSNGLVRGVGDVDAPIDSQSAFRLSAMGQSGAVSTRRKITVEDYGVAPAYRWGMVGPTEVELNALIQHNRDRPDYGQPPLNGAPAKVGWDTIYGYSDDRTIQDIRAVSASVRQALPAGIALRNRLQFNAVDTDARETAPQGIGVVAAGGYAALSPPGVSALPLSALWVQLQSHDRVIHDTSLFDQLELTGEATLWGVGHVWLAGVELGRDDYANQGYARTGSCNGVALKAGNVACTTLLSPAWIPSPTLAETPGNLAKGRADTAAVYASDTLTVTPWLKLVGGLRYDRYGASVTNSVNASNTAGNTTLARASQTVGYTSVRAGALVEPIPALTGYVSYSTSFDPSLEQLTSTTGISQPLPPEDNDAVEAGAKWAPFGERLAVTGAVFRTTQRNARAQNPDNTYTATGTIRAEGLRFGASGRITHAWQVFAGYTHLDARITDAIAPGTEGRVPANTAPDSATLWTTYDIRGWQVGGGATYLGPRYANNTNLVSVPGYTRLDAVIAWRRPRYDVRLNLFNLADARYYDSLIQSDGGRAAPGSGRTAMVSLVWRP